MANENEYSSRHPTIDLDSFSESEYAELQGVYNSDNPTGLPLHDVRSFLRIWKDNPAVRMTMNARLERMPLYINDESFLTRIIALWRMRIGR